MSSADPGLPQEGPNPLELFFEKNKKWIYALAILLVAGLAVNYGLQKLDRAKKNALWREFNEATGFAKAFADMATLQPVDQYPENQREIYRNFLWPRALQEKQVALITGLMDDVRTSDADKLEQLIAACTEDDPRLPWLIWAAANRAYANQEWATCEAKCADLKSKFDDHLLTAENDYPVQVREEKDKPKKKGEDEEEDLPDEKPELEPAKAGSLVGNLLAAAKADKAFRDANRHFFEAPEPDSAESVVFHLAGVDLTKTVEIEIAFYKSASPKHIAAFKKAASEKHFDGMRIHKIKRKGRDNPSPAPVPTTVHLGNPESKQDDRTKWSNQPEDKDEDQLEFEAGMSNLSMFPLMVAAEQGKDGKSVPTRFFFCANDCAARLDGDYVIFGRVVRGGEHIEDIAGRDLADTAQENLGEGLPSDNFKVEKTEVKKRS